MRTRQIIGLLLASTLPLGAHGADQPCQVHVFLFVPSDFEPPPRYQERIDQIVDYTEAFFTREFNRWGHEDMVMPFRRNSDGHVEVTVMRGKEKAADYKPVTVRAEVMDEMRRTNALAGGRQIRWIMVYAGNPPKKFAGFLGGYGEQIGGWSVCNFNTKPGRIHPNMPLGADSLEEFALKGMIHELGHAFQLPHIGLLKRDTAGNTLMGPTNANYRRVMGRGTDQVYLCEAEAAMLSTNPAFRGAVDKPSPLPKLQTQDMKCAVDARSGGIVVSGRVRSTVRPVYAIVGDESDERPGEYWTKTYFGKVEPDGAFEVLVSEPSKSKGTLKTWFAFENGVMTGDGKTRGRSSGIAKEYTYNRNRWTFN
ncbi:MAG TPA: hypothetical protein VMP01_15060 [Pirellulaceae bacterium]|nr:hypothetical protein [Pirellulaceae bacterium]